MSGAAAIMDFGQSGGGGGGGSLVATASGGGSASGQSPTNTFNLACVVTGGSGSYTYLWSRTSSFSGSWTTGGAAADFAATVSGVPGGGGYGEAFYICTVTDTVSGKSVVSNTLTCFWLNTTGGFY